MGIDIGNPIFIVGMIGVVICIIAMVRGVFQIGPDNKKEKARKQRIAEWREHIRKLKELNNTNKTK